MEEITNLIQKKIKEGQQRIIDEMNSVIFPRDFNTRTKRLENIKVKYNLD